MVEQAEDLTAAVSYFLLHDSGRVHVGQQCTSELLKPVLTVEKLFLTLHL